MSGINYELTLIKGFVFDVDGVLSPSLIPMSENGEPQRMANVKDGYALQLAIKCGYKIAIISGGKSEAVRKRFHALGIKDIFLNIEKKIGTFEKWLSDNELSAKEVVYMGDDIPDLACMRLSGLPCAPNDAAWEAKETAIYISKHRGGYGCVRDVVEQVMKAQGNWNSGENALLW